MFSTIISISTSALIETSKDFLNNGIKIIIPPIRPLNVNAPILLSIIVNFIIVIINIKHIGPT